MILTLVNYPKHYEIEQLSRMFFRGLTVSMPEKRDRSRKGDRIYIRKYGRDGFFLYAEKDGRKESSRIRVEKGPIKEEMQMCIAAYRLLCRVTGERPAWGVLTGVRPVRLMRSLYDKSGDMGRVEKTFSDTYLVSGEKLKLARTVFDVQKPILDSTSFNDFSMYISIPFCPSRCSYCSFVSVSIKSAGHLMQGYVDNLCEEIRYTSKRAAECGLNLRTVYIGGGTPTAISRRQLEQVMKTVAECFDLSRVEEYTVEAGRPDCTDLEKLQVIKKWGADRICINPQTFSDNVLRAIGRAHTTEDFLECVKLARSVGFRTINMDLIAGLPEDTVEGFERSLKGCIRLGAENITVHTLTLKRASNLVINSEEHFYDDVDRMIAKNSLLTQAGYLPYYMYRQKATVKNLENVGFSQKGHESLYNIYIMEEVQTIISCGAGGVSKVIGRNGEIKRISNYKYPAEYIKDFPSIIERKEEVFRTWQQFGSRND